MPQEEQNGFLAYIDRYAPSCDSTIYRNRERAPIDKLLNIWSAQKNKYLYRLMGEQLILEREVIYNKPVSEVRNSIYRSIDYDHKF